MKEKSFIRSISVMLLAAMTVLIIGPAVRADGEPSDGIGRFVSALYSECLGRDPDPTGYNEWCQKLASGQITGKQAAYGFFFSDEFLNITLNSYPDETIDRFYRVFLDRPADIDGFYYWYDRLYQVDGSIAELFNGFADSEEFRNKCLSFGVNPGDHIDVPYGFGKTEAYFRLYWEDAFGPEVTSFFENHTDRTPRSTYSASDYAICQQFADRYFRPEWTDLQKLEFTALWIRVNVHYASNGAIGSSYTDAIFNHRNGQCIQYNGAMLAMMSYLGYDVRMVHGHIGPRHNNHYWGEIDVNGVTYIIDTGCIEDNNLHFMVNAAEWADYYTP